MLFVFLLIGGVLLLASPACAKTIDVWPAGPFASIQAAVNYAAAGDTIVVHGGTYAGPVALTKRLTLTGISDRNGSVVIKGSGTDYAIRVFADGTIVQGFILANPGTRGILLYRVNGVTIRNNTIRGAVGDGIGVYNCNDVTLDNNKLYDCDFGIGMFDCARSTATNNYFTGNREIEFYTENLTNCQVRNNHFGYAGYASNSDDGVDGFKTRNSSYLTFDGNIVDSHYYGIVFYTSDHITCSNNVAWKSGVNIRLDSTTYSSVVKNNIVSGAIDNIWIMDSSHHNTYENNDCSRGREGIYIQDSYSNIVRNNKCYDNVMGIRLYNTNGNVITGNNCYRNNYTDVSIEGTSFNNTVYLNDLGDGAVSVGRNSFNSTGIVYYKYGGKAFAGYLGNNWSGYTGVDKDGNGIGDTAYTKNVTDRYPLVKSSTNYVITSGPAPGTVLVVGPQESYTTIQSAVNAASADYTIMVKTGYYPEHVTVSKKLTIKAAPGASPVVDGRGSEVVFTLKASGIRLEGLTIRNKNSPGYGVSVDSGSCTVANNTLDGGCGCIRVVGSGNTIENNKATNGTNGILLYNTKSNVIRNNEVSRNAIGLRLYGAQGNTLTGNYAHDNKAGLFAEDSNSKGNVIYMNDFAGNTEYQASVKGVNTWYSGTFRYVYGGRTFSGMLGNRYSDYAGKDLNGNGVGDTAYVKYGVTDPYPLMTLHTNYRIIG